MINAFVMGLAGLVYLVVTWIETSLAGGMALAGLPARVEAIAWAVIIILCLTSVVRLMGGWIRTLMVLMIVGISAHAGLTHGFAAFR